VKFLIKTTFLLTFSLILLAGCTNPFAQTTPAEQLEVPVALEDEMGKEEPMKIITCDMLKSAEYQVECRRMLNEITADMLSSEIQQTFDLKRCDELSIYMAEDCKNYIGETGVKGPVSDAELEALRNAMNMTYPEVTNEEDEDMESEGYYDLSQCTVLTTPGLKGYCEEQLNQRVEEEKMRQIIEGGDVSRCDELTNEDFKRMCKEEFGVFDEEFAEEESVE
jgi:hypothetical protein